MKTFSAEMFFVGFGEVCHKFSSEGIGGGVTEEEVIEASESVRGKAFRFVVSEKRSFFVS